jgi:hypothetical protein
MIFWVVSYRKIWKEKKHKDKYKLRDGKKKLKYQSLVGSVIIDTELGREDHGSIPTTTVPTNTANRKTLAPKIY